MGRGMERLKEIWREATPEEKREMMCLFVRDAAAVFGIACCVLMGMGMAAWLGWALGR